MTSLRARSGLVQSIVHHNPFYLLSAACMLGGCLALTNSLSFSPIRLPRLLVLMATLNVYELLLVGLALYLLVRRQLRSDANKLLLLEALFMVDIAFLNSEVFTADFHIGLAVNLVVLTLAGIKLALIFRAMAIPLLSEPFMLVVTELVLLFTMPGLFKSVSDHRNGQLPPLVIYGAWCSIAAMPVLYVALMRWGDFSLSRWGRQLANNRTVLRALVALPTVSLVAHMMTANWVYKSEWLFTNLAPPLLGLAVALGTYDRHVRSLSFRLRMHLAIPILAIALSLFTPRVLDFHVGPLALAPLRLVLAGAAVVYAHAWWFHRHLYFAAAASICVALGSIGSDVMAIIDRLTQMLRQTRETSERLIPETTTQWGVVALCFSFVLLAIGALISLRKAVPALEREQEPSSGLDHEPA